VLIETFNTDVCCSIADFEFLPAEPKPEPARATAAINGDRQQSSTEDGLIRRFEKYLDSVPGAIEGNHGDHHTFVAACRGVNDFGLSETDTFNAMWKWNVERCRPPWSAAELEEKILNAAKYANGEIGSLRDAPYRGNGTGPQNVSEDKPEESQQARKAEATADDVHHGHEITERPSQYSDDALADTFSKAYSRDLKYVPEWGWLIWTGQRWRRLPDVLVMEKARPICRSAAQLCREDQNVKLPTRPGLARSIASAKTVAAVERLARGDKRHYCDVREWDADLWAFNTPGGTIDLNTGELRPHRREDLITKISNATPAGECPRFLAFLRRVTDDNDELQRYLQRLAGYALVGDPREECLEFFYGPGGNGKGTFLATLQHVFGEYATTASTDTFVESKGDKHPCDVAKLAAARLVISNEVDEGQRWDEARVKNLTGRDVMTARFMRQDFFDFTPQFTLMLAGNHRPSLKAVDESIRRRFHLIPFEVVIPPEERDENLKQILRDESDGIMRWVLDGCLHWQQQKLNPPAIVLAATSEYLAEEDTFELWLSECCLRGPDYEEPVAWLYESHRQWKLGRGEQAPGQKTFSGRLKDRGFLSGRNSSGLVRVFENIRLTDDEREMVQGIIKEKQTRDRLHIKG
ncbi:MAG: hypothetical protein HY646_04095, partial [Acidobacteria bacterium]|nr:hypothetical protein [Acidobacteriota bacterium]